MAVKYLTVVFLDNTFTGATCPSVTNVSFPYTFAEPIPVDIELELSYLNGNDIYKKTVVASGYMTNYASNGLYPAVAISTVGYYSGSYYNLGANINGATATFIGTSVEKTYKNDTVTRTYTYTDSLQGSCACSGRDYEDTSPTLRIIKSSLPVILDGKQDQGSQLYVEKPDVYFYSNYQTPSANRWQSINNGYDYDRILNRAPAIVPEYTEYFYYGHANRISVDEYGNVTELSGTEQIRGFKLKIPDGRASFYINEGIDNGYLWFTLNIGETPLIAYYSYDCDLQGNGTWQEMEYAPTTLPFSKVYRWALNEVGEFYCAGKSKEYKTFITNVPIYETEEESDAYNEDGTGLENAINYNEIANGYDISNPTGIEDDETIFGENYTRSFFTQCYLCNASAVQEISNNLFDYDVTTLSGIWEDIKKGLEMYGSNPMDVVQGLRFYPFDLSQIFSNVQSQNYIYFGAYQLQLANSSVYKIIYANGYKDLGTVTVKRTFNDWRDFEPYTKLSIYLPYIGRYPLKAERYYGKQVNIRYYIDIRTGLACACLIADGVLLDWFDGQIGTEMPITLTDYASYSQTQINTILRNATIGIGAEGAAGNVTNKMWKSITTYNDNAQAIQEAALMSPSTSSLAAQTAGSYGTQAIAAGVGASVALHGGILVGTGMKTAFDLLKTGTAANTSVKGSSSSMINSFLPQYPTFMFEILEIDESPYLNELYGRPSNASGRIADFSGYLEAEDIMLICPIATDSERQEIIDLVRSGIYI